MLKFALNILTMNKYLSILTITILLFSCVKEKEDIIGCMDSSALNYNSEATINGNCNYAPTGNEPISNLNIHFTQTIFGNPLVINMDYINGVDTFNVQTVRYLISDITLNTDNGDNTILDEVHFVDISIDSTLILNIPEINNSNYTSISFTMGLDPIKNVTDSFLNENFFPSFSWPEFLGGGYHYMQLEGDLGIGLLGYATHTGATNGVDYSFIKNFPITTNLENNDTIVINMEIDNWYSNPHVIDLISHSNGIMGNANAQALLKDNGAADVFSINITQ